MFVDGDLRGQIGHYKKQGALTPQDRILWYLYQISLGLRHLHEKRILHADLKPDNVFVNESGELKLGDLGICKVLVDTSGTIKETYNKGTIYYMPPECFKKKPVNTAADIWAAGCVVYYAMKGEILFRSEVKEENTDAKVAERILKHIPSRLSNNYSRHLRLEIWYMLQKDPAGRPSAQDVLNYLENLVEKSAAGI